MKSKYAFILFIGILLFSVSSISYSQIPNNGLVPQDLAEGFYLSLYQNTNPDLIFGLSRDEDLLYTQIETRSSINTPQYPTEKGIYSVRNGMPKNTRHLKEGYWIGALPEVNNIEPMYNQGIRVILTVTKTKLSWRPVRKKINDLGIEHLYIPIGSRFPQDVSFYTRLLEYKPDEIFVHCDHGGDRSGTVIAYLLINRNHWTPQRALLAMVNPDFIDVNGLKQIFKKYNLPLTEEDLFFTGIYSGASNKGFGGLKVRNEDYRRLVSTMIDTLSSL